ncbi:MAG: Ig-like domain-containing protein, partial [Propionibacteriaceae bacterium]|nr:Ig-like domain-containing protein [Propionibacteriaceae bacterium]
MPIKTLRPFLATVASVALAFTSVAFGLPSAAAADPQVFTPFALNNGFGTDAQTQRVIAWMALNSAQYNAPYIKVSTDAASVTVADPASCTSAAAPAPMATYRVYTCALTGLLPGTTYSYAVGATQGTGAVESPVYSFTTDGGQPFTFLDFADTQASAGQYDSYWGNDLRTALQRTPDAAFVVQNGDITDDGSAAQIQDWLNAVGTSLAGPALNLVLGNHDGDYNTSSTWAAMTPRASLTNPNSYYSFGDNSALEYAYVYGDALFLMVNTNPSGISIAQLNAMAAWIKDTVAQYGHNPDGSQRFVIAVEHKSPFGGTHSGAGTYPAGDYGNPNIVQVLPKAYFEAGVDLVLAGHDHNLIRSLPVTWNYSTGKAQWNRSQIGLDTIDSTTDGLVYYVPSFAGAKNYPAVATSATVSPWISLTKNFSVTPSNDAYSAVTVDATSIHVNTYIVGSTTPVDSFVITHPTSAPVTTVGSVSVSLSTDSVTIGSQPCGGGGVATPDSVIATVTVEDTSGAPMADQDVTVTADAPLIVPSGTYTTDSDGAVEVTLEVDASLNGYVPGVSSAGVQASVGNVSGSESVSVTRDLVPVVPTPILSVAASPTAGESVFANGQDSWTVTATLIDACQSVADVPVTFSIVGDASLSASTVNTNSNGVATITVTDTTTETANVTATANGLTSSPVGLAFDPVPPRLPPTVTVSVDQSQLCVGATATVSAFVADADNMPIPDAVVTFTATRNGYVSPTATTGPDGVATAQLTDLVAEHVVVTASLNDGGGAQGSVDVAFTTGCVIPPVAVVAVHVTPVATTSDPSTWVEVGGSYTVTATAKDSNDNLIPGLSPDDFTFSPSSPDVQVSDVTDNGDGTYSAQLTSTVADSTDTVYAVFRGNTISNSTLPIPFRAGPVDPATIDCLPAGTPGFSVDKTELPVLAVATGNVFVVDRYCNPIPDIAVTFSQTVASHATIVPETAVTGADGHAVATISDNVVETVAFSASLTDFPNVAVQGSPAHVTFTAICGDPMPSTFTVTPSVDMSDNSTWPVSDGVAFYTGTVTARDGGCGGGNLLPNLNPDDFTFTPSSSDVQVSKVVNNGDGTYSAQFTSLRAGADFTVTAQYQGMRIGNPSTTDAGLPIPFKAGQAYPCNPSTGPVNQVIASQSSQTVGQTVDLSAYLVDCDPIVGAVVTFTAISSDAQVVSVQATTDATGLATATITDKTAETVSVGATYTGGSSGGGSLTSTSVTFTAGPSSIGPFECQAGQESTNASASPVVVPSPGPSTVRAYVTDQYCNPVTGALVGFDVPISSHATYFTTPGWGSGYTVNGVVTATLNDSVAETTEVWVSADGHRMATNPASGLFVTFSNSDLAPTMTFTMSYPHPARNTTIADGKDAATGV